MEMLMLNKSSAEFIAENATPRPNGADQAHGLRMLNRPAAPTRTQIKHADLPAPTRIPDDSDLSLSGMRTIFIVIAITVAVVSLLAWGFSPSKTPISF